MNPDITIEAIERVQRPDEFLARMPEEFREDTRLLLKLVIHIAYAQGYDDAVTGKPPRSAGR